MELSEDEKGLVLVKGRLTGRLLLSVVACVIGCSFQFGFQTGILNTPQQIIEEEYKYGFLPHTNETEPRFDDDKTTLLFSVTVAMYGVGGMIAGFSGSYVATAIGRKRMMLFNNLILVIGVTLMFSAKYARTLELIIVGRFIMGIQGGFSTVVAPLYLNEISPVNLRGAMGTLNQLGVTVGILLSQVLGLTQTLGTRELYQWLFVIPAVAGLIQLVLLPLCPESPSWLYIDKKKEDEAKEALETLRGSSQVDGEIASFAQEVADSQTRPKITFKSMFTKRWLRTPLIIAVGMQLSQQFSGIIAVLNYSTSIFMSASLSEQNAQYGTLGTSGVIVAMTFVSVLFMDRLGRRILHITGLSGCLLSTILITIGLNLQDKFDWAKYLSVVALILFILFFACGPGAIPWFLTAELFDQASRPLAVSIATLVNWASNFLAGFLFPQQQKGLKNFCFLPHTAVLLLFIIFTAVLVPETKNKPTEEIVALFGKRETVPAANEKAEFTDSEIQ